MNTHLVKLLWAATAATTLVSIRPTAGQSIGDAPSPWQPYRNSIAAPADDFGVNLAAGVEGITPTAPSDPGAPATPTPVRTAQVPADATVMFPQPVFAAPGCEVPVCVDPSAMPMVGMPATPLVGVPATQYVGVVPTAPPTSPDFWYWRVLPEGVIWQSYWAGVHEPRLSGVAFNDDDDENFLDGTVGGRASILRYGTEGVGRPQGFEFQIEGAAFPRLNLDENWDLDATDFRVGFPLVYGREKWQAKFSYYHLSSHMGDEFAIRNNALADRINYSRDVLTVALSYFPHPAWRFYTEAGWAFYYDVCEPWEFQFGVDVADPGPTGPWGTPFIAVNGHIREEVNYGGNVVAQAGWLWRGNSSQTVRAGFHYYNGKSSQFEFFDQFEQQIGGGLWYDF